MRLAVVLYSYAARVDRHRRLAALSYHALSNIPGISVYVTSRHDGERIEPECFTRIPLQTEDAYELLPDKTIEMVRWLLQRDDWDVLLKCDDDVVLDPGAVRALLNSRTWPLYAGSALQTVPRNPPPSTYHVGRCRSEACNKPTSLAWAPPGFRFAVGTCYSLTRNAAEIAVQELAAWDMTIATARERFDIRGVGAEDLLIAYLLSRRGIHPTHAISLYQPSTMAEFIRHIRDEAWRRIIRRNQAPPCLGVFTHNRPLRKYERALLMAWNRLSQACPPVAADA
jgi:hypothetical protein